MIRPVVKLRPEVMEPGRSTLVDRYLGEPQHAWRLRLASAPPESPLEGVDVELIDTTDHPQVRTEHATLWHLLWVRDEAAGGVTIDDHSWPIAPGDTAPVPAGAPLIADGGQLGLAIRVRDATAAITPPTHGTDRFFGHNRQTLASTLGDIRLCRWKLTQPLALAEHYAYPVLMTALARSVVIRTESMVDQLRQGEIARIDPTTEPVVTPDGLAYLLTIDRPATGMVRPTADLPH